MNETNLAEEGLEDLAQELLTLWNKTLGRDFPMTERLLLQQWRMETAPKRLFTVRSSSGGLLGAALFKLAPAWEAAKAGNLSFLLVEEGRRRRGLGTRLLEAGEAWLRASGAALLRLGGDTYHFFPGAPQDGDPASLAGFLKARGFSAANLEYDVIADLREVFATRETPEPAPGFRFLWYEPGLKQALTDFFSKSFPGRWKADTLDALAWGMRNEDLALAQDQASGAVVGFARVYDDKSPVLGPGLYWSALLGENPGGLGPIGVDPDLRGLGLGLGLLSWGLAGLARRGCRRTVIDWTDLVSFYGKLGFTVWKTYRIYSKSLGPAAPG